MTVKLPRCPQCIHKAVCVYLLDVKPGHGVTDRNDVEVVMYARGIGCSHFETKDKYAWVGRY